MHDLPEAVLVSLQVTAVQLDVLILTMRAERDALIQLMPNYPDGPQRDYRQRQLEVITAVLGKFQTARSELPR